MDKALWEILIPRQDNDGLEFAVEHHRQWDANVRSISGGFTILRTAKGQWMHDGRLYEEPMIPVRVLCTRDQMIGIVDYTMIHYDQLAIFAYAISTDTIFKTRDG